MKPLFAGQLGLALQSSISPLPRVRAQKASVATRPMEPFSYDISKEIKLNGIGSSVLANLSPGVVLGGDLLLATSSGTVDARLGPFAVLGKKALSITTGQYAEVTGVIRTRKSQPVFLTRIVKVDEQVYPIRIKHGFALSHHAREPLSQSAGQKGEQL